MPVPTPCHILKYRKNLFSLHAGNETLMIFRNIPLCQQKNVAKRELMACEFDRMTIKHQGSMD
jgi:hypothetical protein